MEENNVITAIIADDDPDIRFLVREFAASIPNLKFVAEAGDGKEALEIVLRHRPNVAVLDILMPAATGKQVLDEITRRGLNTRVLLMTGYARDDYFAPGFWADAMGYLYKGDGLEECLVPALKALMRGLPFVSPTPLRFLRQQHSPSRNGRNGNVVLTAAESDVLKLTVRGKSDKEIATALQVPVRTVEKRKSRLRRKLGVQSTIELVVYAVTHRIFDEA